MTNSLVRSTFPITDLERLVDHMWSNSYNPWPVNQSYRSQTLNTRPVYTEEGNAVVEVDVPGVEPSEVKVRIEGKSLTVETPRGNAYITIGQRLDPDSASASLKHGLLTIRIPKRDSRIVEVSVHEE